MMLRPFDPALMAMGGMPIFGPVSFRQYLQENGLPARDTAASISVDSLERLRPELRAAETMVLRLGSDGGIRTTRFALIRSPAGLSDFFLCHDKLFDTLPQETFLPSVSWKRLYAFQILPSQSEAALINLGLASGLISHALHLDEAEPMAPPATGHSTFTFPFFPYSEAEQPLQHVTGQVEFDAMFIARRDGRECVFILEAKVGNTIRSIAKHKLVYPVLAMAKHVPPSMPIIPVYVHASVENHGIRFSIAECEYDDPRSVTPILTALRPKHVSSHTIPLTYSK